MSGLMTPAWQTSAYATAQASTARPRPPQLFICSIVLALSTLAATLPPAVGVVGCSRDNDDISGFRGARLGMSARDTRARFQTPAAGSWAASVATTGEEAITWKASDASAEVSQASFEFHNGMMVAIRVTEAASAPGTSETGVRKSAVSVRQIVKPSGSDPSAHLTILARDCPTHAAEVAAILK